MKQYSFLKESKETFSLDKFKSFTNIHDRIKYCNQTLEILGYGVGKRVYKLDDKRVLKVAYNKGGYGQNECEAKISKYKFPFLCYTYEYDDKKYTWLISELCYITTGNVRLFDSKTVAYKNSIIRVTGYPPETIWFLGFTCVVGGIDLYKKIRNDLMKVCKKIIEIRKTPKYLSKKNLDVAMEACKLTDIPEASKKIIRDRFYGTIYNISKQAQKDDPVNLEKLFGLIDNGTYKKIYFINEMVKIKNLNSVLFLDDCFNYSNTGIVNRNGKDYLVILDYGWSREMDKNWRKKK